MMNNSNPSDLGVLLQQAIQNISLHDQRAAQSAKEQTIHVPNVANVLLFAYEQLRNASENIEDHLLFQRAILRFYKRNLVFATRRQATDLGQELVIELTQAGYLKNDSVAVSKAKELDELIATYYSTFWEVKDKHSTISPRQAEKWTLEILSVKSEQIFNNPIRILSFAHFAHTHFSKLIKYESIIDDDEEISAVDYPTLLYISIHKALLRSDDANVRSGLMDLYSLDPTNAAQFVEFNTKYDALAALSSTNKLSRFISNNGAPLRIIRSTFFNKYDDNKSIDLQNQSKTLTIIESQIDEEYKEVRKNLNKGILKSIAFLLITKALIGLLIEIPYDILVTGAIVIMPLIINLLFPPLFIAVTALTFRLPGPANKRALSDYIQSMIYNDVQTHPLTLKYTQPVGRAYLFNTVYIIMFIFAFYFVASRLAALDFNIAQGIIFFIFLSTASFLGYRLTLQIKELEIVNTNQGVIALLRDFLYAPFIFVGKKISYRFSQLNIIAQILDVAIDLPLKTMMKLVRQWMIFLNNKKDELL